MTQLQVATQSGCLATKCRGAMPGQHCDKQLHILPSFSRIMLLHQLADALPSTPCLPFQLTSCKRSLHSLLLLSHAAPSMLPKPSSPAQPHCSGSACPVAAAAAAAMRRCSRCPMQACSPSFCQGGVTARNFMLATSSSSMSDQPESLLLSGQSCAAYESLQATERHRKAASPACVDVNTTWDATTRVS
jgi:hypothetical protein